MEKGLLHHLMSYMETRIRVELAKNFVYPNMGSKTMPYFKIPIWLDVQSPPTLNKEMLGLGGQ